MNWYLKVFKQYADFNGRARRKEYWMFYLFNMIFSWLLYIPIFIHEYLIALPFLYMLAIIIPLLAVTVRRLHDQGKSGWMFFVGIIPLVGPIWLLILMASEGTPGPNQYGEDPKASERTGVAA